MGLNGTLYNYIILVALIVIHTHHSSNFLCLVMSEATYTRPTAGSWQLFPQDLPGSLLPVFLGESLGTRLHIPNQEHNGWWLFTCDAPGVQGICVPMMSSSNLEGCVKLSMATPPSSMSAVLSFRWEVTGWEEVTSLDGRNGGEGIRSKGHFFI